MKRLPGNHSASSVRKDHRVSSRSNRSAALVGNCIGEDIFVEMVGLLAQYAAVKAFFLIGWIVQRSGETGDR
jgi:hypothetical protein